jgi:hypothetical protein
MAIVVGGRPAAPNIPVRAPPCGISRWHIACNNTVTRAIARTFHMDEEKEMKASRILIATTAAALLPLAAAVAGDNDQYGKEKDKSMMPDTVFKKLDSNGDGRISQAEAAADSTIVFTTADANGDGYLDSAEWKASTKGSTSPTPQSAPTSPAAPEEPATTPPPDTETPRQ